MNQWYVQFADKIFGPLSLEDLRRRMAAGQVPQESLVREGPNGAWTAASRVAGLSPGVRAAAAPPVPHAHDHEPAARRTLVALRPCPDCGEMISQQASLCPRCGRSLMLTTIDVPYRGEHPISVLVFFSLLALVFLLAMPMAVYFAADWLGAGASLASAVRSRVSFLAAAAYAASIVVCAVLGRAVGAARMALFTGTMLGLFFGPLGVLVAFAVDKRTQCPNCYSRLGGLARECPDCHARLRWERRRRWY